MADIVWRVVKLPKRPIGGPWWLQQGRWAEGLGWAMRGRRFEVRYEESHPTRESAERSLAGFIKQGAMGTSPGGA